MNGNKNRLLITGVSGLLGANLGCYFKDKYEVLGLYHSHPVAINGIYTEKCDITCSQNIKAIISRFNPSIIIHCASLTNIDQCEIEQDVTNYINVLSTRYLVESITDDTLLIYLSTDAVYDGSTGNFTEDDYDRVMPRNHYGISKHAGEIEVRKSSNFLVLRTNIFGWNIQNKKSLGEWILGELHAGRSINCFRDAFFSSIYTFELARVIDVAIQKGITGLYNCGSSDSCSKYEFALRIADCFDLDKTLIRPISIDTFDFKAKRGKNLSLNVNKLQNDIDYKLPTISQSIESFYRDYKCEVPKRLKKGLKNSRGTDRIPYGRQNISGRDIESVVNVLRSDRITQGPMVEAFERSLSDYCDSLHGVAMNSATSALHAACLASDVGSGDEVITSPITFVASANCALYCGAKPVFADIDLRTYNISPQEIEKRITRHTKAVVPVHFAGQSCDMESIHDVVRMAEKKYGHRIYIIEDACHALGSLYKGKKVGACTYSDMTVMSFHPVKHITTGEGGIVLTNDELLAKQLKLIRSHGITTDPDNFLNTDLAFRQSEHDASRILNLWYYEQTCLGYNYRITDIQSALGISQLNRLDSFIQRRREIVRRYNTAFKDTPCLTVPFEDQNCHSNFHLYVLLIDYQSLGIHRASFMMDLREHGIQTQVHYIPVHLQPFYQEKIQTKKGDFPNAEEYYLKCLSIPIFPAMTTEDNERVIDQIYRVIGKR